MTEEVAILVVDDEALILVDVADQLREEGFTVYEAGNADIAIEMLSQHADIRLIFTDIDMPGSMDGLKLAAAVRDRWPPVKIIVTSGRYRIDTPLLPDGSAFFTKPYSHVDIVRSMRQMLAQ
jgi:CheY-like chemotaxis protein